MRLQAITGADRSVPAVGDPNVYATSSEREKENTRVDIGKRGARFAWLGSQSAASTADNIYRVMCASMNAAVSAAVTTGMIVVWQQVFVVYPHAAAHLRVPRCSP